MEGENKSKRVYEQDGVFDRPEFIRFENLIKN